MSGSSQDRGRDPAPNTYHEGRQGLKETRNSFAPKFYFHLLPHMMMWMSRSRQSDGRPHMDACWAGIDHDNLATITQLSPQSHQSSDIEAKKYNSFYKLNG